MTSLSSHGGDSAHKNGMTEEKSEGPVPVNDQKIMTAETAEEPANIQKMLEKAEATVLKGGGGMVPIGDVPEKTTVVPQNDEITAPSAATDPAPLEPEESKKSEVSASGEDVVADQPQAEKPQSETVQTAPVKVGEGTDDKSVDADDELAQIRKELASSEPTKSLEEGHTKSLGEIESTDQAPPEESIQPANQEQTVEKETVTKEAAEEPMEVDEKHEDMLNSIDRNTEIKTVTSKEDTVTNENSMSDTMEKDKDKTDQPGVDSVLKEDDLNSKAEGGDSAEQSASGVDQKEVASKAHDEKPEPGEEEKSDIVKPDNDVLSLNARDTLSPTNDGEKDEVKDENKEAETVGDKKESKEESEEENEEEDGKEQVPLLERPPETSGRRARKAVDRFSETGTPETKRSSLPLEQGRGAKLSDCPVVNGNIGSGPPEQVHALHQVVFGRQGRPHEFRRNLRQFSGFSFRPDEPGYAKKRDSLLRYRLDALRSLSHLLNLDTKNKSREELAQGVLDFLVEPTPTDTVVDSAKKRGGKTGKARSSSRRSAAASEEEEDEEDEDDDDDDEEDEDEEPVKKTPSRKTSKRTPAKKTPAKKTPAKRTPAKKTPAKRTPAKKAPAKKTPAKSAGRKTPARQSSKRKRRGDASDSEEEEEVVSPPASKRTKTGRAPPRARR